MRALLLMLCASLACLSCGSKADARRSIARYEPSKPPPERPVVALWIQPDAAELTLPQLQAGCAIWAPEGARCAFVGTYADARVHVWAYRGACVRNSDGLLTLATAYPDGKILVNIECFRRDDKTIDLDQLSTVFGHELGHQFGVWKHPPLSCSEKGVKTHPSGQKICGPALMNPIYRKEISYLTEIDALAFDQRQEEYSVLVSTDPSRDEPICVYRAE